MSILPKFVIDLNQLINPLGIYNSNSKKLKISPFFIELE